MRQGGLSVISFAAGEPDFDTPNHIKDAAIEAIALGFTKYTATSGIQELKLAISKKFKDDNRLNYDPSQIIVSSGAKHSLYNCLQVLCEKGDEVIIPSPYWVSYPEMIKLAEAKPIIIQTNPKNNFKLTKKLLQSAITKKTKALILNTPSNPTGSIYNLEELKAVAEIAVSNKIWVISDEIYEKIIYDGSQHTSIASLQDDIYNLTITVNGVSKTYSMTGWRIGYLAGPRELAAAINNLQDHSTSNPTSIAQKAALAALTGNQDCVEVMIEEFQKRRDYTMEKLKAIEGLNPIKPEGAFYIFCDISKFKIDSTTFACRLLEETKVAVIPGVGFGRDDYIRLSFATGMDEIKEGIDRLAKFLAETEPRCRDRISVTETESRPKLVRWARR
jgi:aspartate aminotransferase